MKLINRVVLPEGKRGAWVIEKITVHKACAALAARQAKGKEGKREKA